MQQLMIKVEDLKKEYKLGQIGGSTLHEELQRKFAKLRGKEDPTKKIGSKDYKAGETFMALNGVSFEVKKGERLGIIGHNGAGKSTLLKLLSRITAPTEGRICLNGRVASMLEVGTGFHGELTGRENIYMNGAILGMTKAEIDSKMEQIIEFSECRQFIDTPVKRYSSGMYVKLAFSVAAHLDSEIMIMDEVLAVGDMAFQEKCLGKMEDVSEADGRTVLYVSHNMNTIRALCNRCLVLSHGEVIFNGDVESAISTYLSAASTSASTVDLHAINRSEQFSDESVRMQSFSIGSDSSVYYTGQKMKAGLTVFSNKALENVRLEIPVRTVSGVSIARYFSSPEITLNANSETRIDFEMDISCLAPGKYTLNPVLREINSWGTQKNLDGIVDAFCFEIVPAAGFNNGTQWNSIWNGHYVVPAIQIRR